VTAVTTGAALVALSLVIARVVRRAALRHRGTQQVRQLVGHGPALFLMTGHDESYPPGGKQP
jgi:hypothetical protein